MERRKLNVNAVPWRKVLIIVFWALVWHGLALWVDNSILLVTPSETVRALTALLPLAEFWQTILVSLLRIGGGFFLGSLCGVVLAGLGWKSRMLKEALTPVMNLLKAIPVASFAVILLIWWGSSMLAVAISFLVVLPNIYIQTLEGLKSTDKKLLEMAEVLALPFWTRFLYIYRPALKPFLYGSMKVSLGMSWKSGVAAEVIGTPDFSIGERLYLSKIYLDTAGVFAWTVVVILLSLCFEKAVLRLLDQFYGWEPPCKKAGSSDAGKGARTPGEIVCSKVSKGYGRGKVLEEFSASYGPGGKILLTSPSGSGKTTLLRLLCGLEQPDSDEIARKGSSSMMFQEDRLCEEYSALRNVEMVVGDKIKARSALLELLEEEALDGPCGRLSGGMKRRVALVRAMEAESDIVLLDEPFTGMDADTQRRARSYIQKKQNGRLLVMASHSEAGREESVL